MMILPLAFTLSLNEAFARSNGVFDSDFSNFNKAIARADMESLKAVYEGGIEGFQLKKALKARFFKASDKEYIDTYMKENQIADSYLFRCKSFVFGKESITLLLSNGRSIKLVNLGSGYVNVNGEKVLANPNLVSAANLIGNVRKALRKSYVAQSVESLTNQYLWIPKAEASLTRGSSRLAFGLAAAAVGAILYLASFRDPSVAGIFARLNSGCRSDKESLTTNSPVKFEESQTNGELRDISKRLANEIGGQSLDLREFSNEKKCHEWISKIKHSEAKILEYTLIDNVCQVAKDLQECLADYKIKSDSKFGPSTKSGPDLGADPTAK
jgi:hypothetical protein